MLQAKIGVQAMMLKEKFAELGAYETLKRVSELGYNAIEISQIPMTPENVAEIKRAKEDFGLDIAALSCQLKQNPNRPGGNDALNTDFDKIVAGCKELDVDLIRVGMLPFENMKNKDTALEFCRELNEYAVRMKEHGIKVYYHNHHVEFRRYDGKFLLDIIAEECPEIGFELDVHWVQRGGCNPVETVRKYKGRVDLIHLKDYRVGALPEDLFEGKKSPAEFYNAFVNIIEFAELGQGSMDFKPIIEACLESDVRYLLVEQDMTYGRDPFDCLAESRDHLIELGYKHLF